MINVRPTQTRVAYIEDRELVDLKIERRTSPTLVGSIYRGRVMRVLPGMQAAFVDIGLDRAAFLYVGDVRTDQHTEKDLFDEAPGPKDEDLVLEGVEEEEEESKVNIQDLLKEGQSILVQVAKDPLGSKGARITTHISLPGRHLVFMPTITHLGISRRIEDETERERLRSMVEKLQPKGGVIVRTAGEGATEQSLGEDLDYLHRLWKEIEKNYQKEKGRGSFTRRWMSS